MKICNIVNQLSYKIGIAGSRNPVTKKLYNLGANAIGILPGIENGKVRNWINVSLALESLSKSYQPTFPHVSPLKNVSMSDLIDRYNVFLVDLYGVVHLGKEISGERIKIEKAVETLNKIKTKDKILIFLSNTADRSVESIVEDLKKMGLEEINKEQIVTSGMVLTEYIKRMKYKRVVNIGNNITAEYIRAGNCEPLQFDKNDFKEFGNYKEVDAVIIGYRRGIQEDIKMTLHRIEVGLFNSHEDLSLGVSSPSVEVARENNLKILKRLVSIPESTQDVAFNAIRLKGVPIIVANADEQVPYGENIVIIGTGTYRRLFDFLPNAKVITLGKPSTAIFEMAKKSARNLGWGEFAKEEMLMIGDTLECDISGARNFGIDSLLVLSGLLAGVELKTLEKAMLTKGLFPTYILPSIVV